ncbi:MAG: PD40 domain-containing protein [Vicingus serpentipes]|nr:PD40 domain-containing protein [Vicingus serpentipes]
MIKKQLHKQLFIFIAFLTLTLSVCAQYSSEEELKTASDELFDKEQYNEALPLFAQLLSLYPKDLNYNYKYGACLLFATRDKEKSLKYLKFAVSKSTVDPEAYYFLAKAHHFNYEFDPAIVYYNKFKGKADAKQLQKYNIEREVEMCENGKSLLKNIVDIGVLDKKEIKEADFFRSYSLKGIGGKVIVKPDEFKSKLDVKKEETSLVYLGETKDVVIYSSYGTDGKNGRDLFRVEKTGGTEWSKPINLGEGINTKYDEDYPFLHPDGKTLYFSSKGYNSMGGYDVFKSTYNSTTGKWSVPENLDFPINTPGDDILYISDIDNKLAYFASSRASKQGELTVYRVTVDPQPVKNTAIKGIFLAEANPAMKSATITIKDVEQDKRYGVYKTHDVSGEYMLLLPSNGGKYKILVETTSDAPVHSAIIDVPVLEKYRALKQELRLVGEGDAEKLVVKNLFDESDEFDITDPLVVQNILKARANLDVNTTEEEALNTSLQTSLNNALKEKNNEENSNYANLSDEELVEQVQEQSQKLINQAETSRNQANYSYQIAQEKSAKAKKLFEEAKALYKEADVAINDVERKEKQATADKKKLEAARLINETAAVMNIARSLENEANERASDTKAIKAIQEKAASGDRGTVEEGKEKLDEIASATYQTESALSSEKDIAETTYQETEEAYRDEVNNLAELNNRKNNLIKSINQLEEKKNSTKKKKEIEEIDLQLKTLEIDMEDVEFDLDAAKKRAGNLYKDYAAAQNKYEVSKEVVAQLEAVNTSKPKVDDIEKLKIENNISYFEDEGLLGFYPPEEETTAMEVFSYKLDDHKEEYKIIDDEGKLIDYNTQYGAALADVDVVDDEEEKSMLIAKVNKEWIASIDEEIEIRNHQLDASTSEGEKDQLKNKIKSLKNLKAEKQKEIDLLSVVAEDTNNETDGLKEEEKEIDENNAGLNENVGDYEAQYTEELSQLADEDSYEAYTQKSNLHKKWAQSIEKDIANKKSELPTVDEASKQDLEIEIAMLENSLQEQKEYAALYEMQAESVQPEVVEEETDPVLTDVVEEKEPEKENGVEEKIPVEKEKVVEVKKEEPVNQLTPEKKKEPVEQEKVSLNQYAVKEENLTANNLNAEEDEFSNLKYNNKYEYKSQQSKKEMEKVAQLKSEAAQLNEEAEILINSMDNMTSIEEKGEASSKADELKKQSYEKQDQVATIYENANRNEFYNNEATLSNIKKSNKTPDSEAAVMAGLLADESNIFYKQAKEKRKKAEASNSFVSKEIVLQEAYELEMKSIEKQNQAIALYLEQGGDEVLTLVETEKTFENEGPTESLASKTPPINTEVSTQKEPVDDLTAADDLPPVEEEEPTNENETPSSLPKVVETKPTTSQNKLIDNTTTSATGDVEPFEVYEPLAIALPSSDVEAEAKSLETEAEVLKAEAKILTDSAETVKKKKEREPLIAEANELSAAAEKEMKEAEVLYAQAEEMKTEEETLLKDLSETRTAVANEQLTPEETTLVTSLSPAEIKETRESEDYQMYSNTKKETRRLIKEAQVEYIEADKVQEEADDQKTLEISLNAMLAGAQTEEDKAKKRSQIEKLKGMIEENEIKAAELRKSATEKEKQALENNKKNDEILANSEVAENIKAIEKVETYNSSLLDKSTIVSDDIVDNTPVTNEVTEEDLVAEEQPIIEEERENFAVNKPVQKEQTEVTNKEATEPVVTKKPINSTPVNIDEIPTVLEESIFVLNNNQAEYSDNKPIPVSPKLPEGLVFKVQIGAFRNPIPQSHFKGFAPIMAEDAGNGITRYTAGFFKKFNAANEAKSDIQSIGYSDAFVVAFFNGERINISKARAMQDGGDDLVTNNTPERPLPQETNTSTEKENTTIPEVAPKISPVTEEVKDGVSTDVRNIDGVFYTIQVGVYSKPITADQLNNLTPINSERIQNGLIRYTSGVHKNLDAANTEKERIRSIGISDAFIIAYNGGARISVAQANELLGNTIISNLEPQQEAPKEKLNEEVLVEEINEPNEESESINQEVDVRYKVQLGEYEEEVPIEAAGIFLRLTGRGVKSYEENGKTIYTIGSYPDYQSAIDTQIEMKEMGVENPKVIAYKDNIQITVEEALEIQKNN